MITPQKNTQTRHVATWTAAQTPFPNHTREQVKLFAATFWKEKAAARMRAKAAKKRIK